MKTTILNITLLLLTVSAYGQTQILKNYDFNKGGYYLLGTFSESDRSTLRDSIGEFYTDDISILNKFKKDWTFKKPGKRYACGYHYEIFICKQGEILESFSINLNCEEIVTDKGYFYFDPNLLRQFYGKLKKPYHKNLSFNTITEARAYRTKILKDTTLIMTPNPLWTEYEGSFIFTYKCQESEKKEENIKILKSIETKIKKKYPNEKFMLYEVGSSLTTIKVQITCNKSLSDKFDLYYRDKKYFGEWWSPFGFLSLKTYWKIKK